MSPEESARAVAYQKKVDEYTWYGFIALGAIVVPIVLHKIYRNLSASKAGAFDWNDPNTYNRPKDNSHIDW